jgi:integrase
MVRAELMGSHSHSTLAGVQVHVWCRGGTFLGRGYYEGQPFGETLGDNVTLATARLRQLLGEIENGSFVRASDSRKRLIGRKKIQQLTARELISEFVAEKRRSRGLQTANDYKARLMPVLAFAEQTATLKRWPLAKDINREFLVSLRSFLFQYRTTRNGRAGGTPKPLSSRQIVNIMECVRTLLAWASSPATRKLPAGWVNPMTAELIGQPPAKDPVREDKLPLELRSQLIGTMDVWQLCHLVFSMVLPLRPDEAEGLLISDVNFERGWFEFGHSFTDCNFTKGGTAFQLPFPAEFVSILRTCIGGRVEGPLLRMRKGFEAGGHENVNSLEELQRRFDELLLKQPPDSVQAPHDRKVLFRSLLRTLGGISGDVMNKEFKRVLAASGINNGATIYTLRTSVTTSMSRAKLPHLEMRYLTSHSTSDILNTYTSLDPVGVMQQYFGTIRPLLAAIKEWARELRI